jgi:hypothetical protein
MELRTAAGADLRGAPRFMVPLSDRRLRRTNSRPSRAPFPVEEPLRFPQHLTELLHTDATSPPAAQHRPAKLFGGILVYP